jgi:ribonuclease BN (tRNA processing enzyme)
VFLGTGAPNPDPERFGPATAVVVDGVAYIFDAGAGVTRRANAAAQRHAIPGLAPAQLAHLFITHLHSDHTLGYPDLWMTGWIMGRVAPLEVYGPPGIAAMTEHLREAWAEDLAIRIHGLEHEDEAKSHVTVHEIEAGVVFTDERVKVTAIPVHHGTWAHAFAYRIDGPDRSIVITGDYAPPTDTIAAACNGCDVLVSEAYSASGRTKEKPDWQAYLAAFHTSTLELGALATAAKAKRVILTHWVNPKAVPAKTMLDEIHTKYAGPVTIANDLDLE